MERNYRIGTRRSPLALKQTEEVIDIIKKTYPSFKAEIIGIDTYGDKDKATPISEIEGTDFFTKEIDEALINKDIDIAVHSAKDLPDNMTTGLCIAVITESIDIHDVLVSRDGAKLNELPYGAKIGTSSQRRKIELKRFRGDFNIVGLRGTISERLEKLDRDGLDGIVIAAAGLIRLGLEKRITERIPLHILNPHPMQGRLAVIAREEDEDVISMCRNHIPTS